MASEEGSMGAGGVGWPTEVAVVKWEAVCRGRWQSQRKGEWRQCGQLGGQAGASHTLKAHGGEEGDVAGLQWALVCTFGGAGLWLRLSSQRGVVHLAALGLEDADVGWHSIATFHLHQVAHHQLICIDLELVPISDNSCLL